MTDFKLKQINDTYFDLLMQEGIPEKYVASYSSKNGEVEVTVLSGKTYKKKIKTNVHVETTGNVREGLVSSSGESSGESGFSRDWSEVENDGNIGNSDCSQIHGYVQNI